MISLLVLLCLAAVSVFAQPPDSLWSRSYGTESQEQCHAVIQTLDGGFLLGGERYPSGGNHVDAWLVKTDSLGDTVWSRIYGGPYYDACTSILPLSDGGYLIGGIYGVVSGSWDYWIFKINYLGYMLWSQVFHGPGSHNTLSALIQASDGSFIAVGSGAGNAWIVRLDSDGDTLWSQAVGGASYEECHNGIETSDGTIVLVGTLETSSDEATQAWIAKVSGDGSGLMWSRTYGRQTIDNFRAVIEESDGNLVSGGTTVASDELGFCYWLVCTSATGDSLWSVFYENTGNDYVVSLCGMTDGGFVLGGNSTGESGVGNARLLRTDMYGQFIWSRNVGSGELWATTESFHVTNDGGFIIAGRTSPPGPVYNFNYWLVRMSAEGLYTKHDNRVPSSLILSSFPNPFNATTDIRFDLPVNAHVELSIFNTLGQRVTTLVDEPRALGSYSVAWDGSNAASGIYLCQLKAGNSIQTRKMVLLK